MTILSIVNAAIPSLPDPSRKSRMHWGPQEEPNENGGPSASSVTPTFVNNPATRWVMVAMELSNLTCFCVVYCGQRADSPAGAQTPMRGDYSYFPLDDILPPPAEDIIHDIGEKSDDDSVLAQCKSVPKQHTILQDPQGDLIIPSKYF